MCVVLVGLNNTLLSSLFLFLSLSLPFLPFLSLCVRGLPTRVERTSVVAREANSRVVLLKGSAHQNFFLVFSFLFFPLQFLLIGKSMAIEGKEGNQIESSHWTDTVAKTRKRRRKQCKETNLQVQSVCNKESYKFFPFVLFQLNKFNQIGLCRRMNCCCLIGVNQRIQCLALLRLCGTSIIVKIVTVSIVCQVAVTSEEGGGGGGRTTRRDNWPSSWSVRPIKEIQHPIVLYERVTPRKERGKCVVRSY